MYALASTGALTIIGRAAVVLTFVTMAASTAWPQQGSNDDVAYQHVGGSVYMLTGGGGANISMSAGSDGVLMVDSKGPRVTNRIIEIAGSLSTQPIRFLINGHVHPDHTDGNAGFGERGVTIIANQAVRDVLLTGQRGGPPAPKVALPVITFPAGGRLSLYFNGEQIDVFHVPPAHAPGNSVVHYRGSNVLHVGDLFGPERYPVIAGGTVAGFIEALDIVVRLANVDTVVIPGVGPASDREGLIQYREMLIVARDRANAALDDGKTLEEFIALQPTREYDAVYGDPSHPLFLPVLYEEMALRRH